MSDQHLTVAELLARAAKESEGGTRASRPRRRRSVEEGGVSVAELTGTFPAVQKAPSEPRHTSMPLDAVVQDRPASTSDAAAPVETTEAEEAEAPKLTKIAQAAAATVKVAEAEKQVAAAKDATESALNKAESEAKTVVEEAGAKVEEAATKAEAVAEKMAEKAEQAVVAPVAKETTKIAAAAAVAKVKVS